MTKIPLHKRIYNLHLGIVKELNNSHIFINKTREILMQETEKIKVASGDIDRTYNVPSRKGKLFSKEAFRTDKELKGILTEIIQRDLFENFLVTNVSKFENYLFKNLSEVITEYPDKLGVSVQGIKPYKIVPIDFVVESVSIDQLFKKIIKDRIINISYSTPIQYLNFFKEVTGCPIDSEEFEDYIEIKATRDLIIHNDSRVNQVYLDKSGNKSRASITELIPIDNEYFNFTIATMKRVSGIIKRELEKKFKKNTT